MKRRPSASGLALAAAVGLLLGLLSYLLWARWETARTVSPSSAMSADAVSVVIVLLPASQLQRPDRDTPHASASWL